ncbi:MAG: hypothetical protein ACR2FF_07335 [Mycobacteriales bacterium]|nr:MAG: hypothetical protein DLM56_03055 [Pseudonocardiales bacterium]
MRSDQDGWIVGNQVVTGDIYRTVMLHWNGSALTVTAIPHPEGRNGFAALEAASHRTATDARAVGVRAGVNAVQETETLRWNGDRASALLIYSLPT